VHSFGFETPEPVEPKAFEGAVWHLVAKTKPASPQHKLFVSPSFRVLSVQAVAIATRS